MNLWGDHDFDEKRDYEAMMTSAWSDDSCLTYAEASSKSLTGVLRPEMKNQLPDEARKQADKDRAGAKAKAAPTKSPAPKTSSASTPASTSTPASASTPSFESTPDFEATPDSALIADPASTPEHESDISPRLDEGPPVNQSASKDKKRKNKKQKRKADKPELLYLKNFKLKRCELDQTIEVPSRLKTLHENLISVISGSNLVS